MSLCWNEFSATEDLDVVGERNVACEYEKAAVNLEQNTSIPVRPAGLWSESIRNDVKVLASSNEMFPSDDS